MKFGVCGDLTVAQAAARAGYDFAEWSVGALLKPREPEEAFLAGIETVRAAGVKYPVVNCFVPADLKITGDTVDRQALRDYVACTMERAERAGVEVIVFGSGGARRIPDGFDGQRARAQIVEFCAMVGPIAQDHGVTVVVEPLNRAECNILNTVGECAGVVRDAAHPSIRLLVDAYHLMRDSDSYADIVTHGDLLRHVHIATATTRLAPGAEPCDFAAFFTALAKARYTGRISIESKLRDLETELPQARALMVRLAGTAHGTK